DPARRLVTPHEGVLLERDVVLDGVVVSRVQPAPVVHVTRRLDRTPLAFVLRRELVPVLREVRAHAAIGGDVAHKERGKTGAAAATAAHVAEPDDAIAMQPFAQTAAAAAAIRVDAGVVGLRFGLP